MKCRELQSWLQDGLDIGRLVFAPDVDTHLQDCESCRRDVAAAKELLGGLGKLKKPQTSALLTASIVEAVKADRANRRRRSTYGWTVTAALAAALLLMVGIGSLRPTNEQVVKKTPDVKQPETPPVQLAQQAEDAQKAMASLTKSVSDSARSRIQVFLPGPAVMEARLPKMPEFDDSLDPAAQSLKRAGLSVANTFEPMARTTVRAFDFFARESAALDPSSRN